MPNTGVFYCAIGFGGQYICVRPDLQRVSVQQHDYESGTGTFIMAAVALDETTLFEEGNTENITDGNMMTDTETSAATGRKYSVFADHALGMFLIGFTAALLL